MDPRVAAVIPTHNRKELLIECIQSLLEQSRPLDGIIVMDNASSDGSTEALRERFASSTPEIEVHRIDRNTGGSGGFHAATEIAVAAGYDWIWYTDDDSEPAPDALETLLNAAGDLKAQGKHPVGLAPAKYDIRGRLQAAHNGRFTWRQIPVPERKCHGIVPIQYAAFTGLLVRRDAILSEGSVRPEYFHWGVDIEFCLRIGKAGPLFLVSRSSVLHKDFLEDPASRFRLGNFWRYYFGMRNWVDTARIYRGYWTLPFIAAACMYRILTIWLWMDRKVLRSRLILKAFVDGVRGDFSDPVTPDRWYRITGREIYDPARGETGT